MKKVFSIAFTFVLLVACIKREDVKPEIKIPAESAQIFSSGISFDASANSATVKFSATDAWTAEATDTKASSWLSIQPSSGKAGEVSMTLSASANPSTEDRTTKVSIVCGTARKEFTVKQSGIEVIAVTSVTLDQTSLTLEEEQTATLAATVKPDDATDKTVTWSSSDATVAKVDETGKVTAVKEGTATITAKAGEKSATCEVTVKKKVIEVESVTLVFAENGLSLHSVDETVIFPDKPSVLNLIRTAGLIGFERPVKAAVECDIFPQGILFLRRDRCRDQGDPENECECAVLHFTLPPN